MTPKILAYIPARAGSTRIRNKNIKKFLGKPLIAYTIEQARSCDFVDRVIVDTDSEKIARIAKKYGAEVPWLRPQKFARDNSKVMDAILHFLARLQREQNYVPDYLMILQTTSPLREQEDILRCWKAMKGSRATSVLTVTPTHPRLYHLSADQYTVLVNGSEVGSSNAQSWPDAYLLNGSVYIIHLPALLKEKRAITRKNKAVIMPKWRSLDIDIPEEWVMAELFYKHKKQINAQLKKF
ncbi:MAG: hypothetical protein A2846_03310 [Candidatus Doudnabacteria bacterium RIFCSPHIGHO2_01_FULL_49_9]|uniref:Acylneuraminate cytidylyltransferase n=1 Tax=Candidatus Doudnabacteria bacterium RIFCSPHIGHO2_01_FULL_49_9 TaxID=1817827 RepID=A0A1F5NZ99_9BACT|nr:MAG: hypothetical protein A2846_03310 [Candidatus Doudnabacteria bacterium RIFCSPHIGHO2_01_FULL_49_9]